MFPLQLRLECCDCTLEKKVAGFADLLQLLVLSTFRVGCFSIGMLAVPGYVASFAIGILADPGLQLVSDPRASRADHLIMV